MACDHKPRQYRRMRCFEFPPFSARRQRVFFVPLMLAAVLWLCSPALALGPEDWRAQGWSKTDFSKSSIDLSEIFMGGPPRDGIPPLDRPVFKMVSETRDLALREPVITLVLNGDARAYPLQVMIWHEIANDTVGGVPVTVTFCPLCNTAIAFHRRLDGKVLDFGTTGLLRNSDLVMYDRQTQSWWQQFTGEAIVGEMTGKELKMIPTRLESYERFKAAHPQGKVLHPNSRSLRQYGRNPYAGYDRRGTPYGLFRGEFPRGINPMARVVAVETSSGPFAVSLALLREKRRIEKDDVVLGWVAGQLSALDTAIISKGRDVGNVTAQRKGKNGMEDLVYHLTFAFAFYAFHPEIPIKTR